MLYKILIFIFGFVTISAPHQTSTKYRNVNLVTNTNSIDTNFLNDVKNRLNRAQVLIKSHNTLQGHFGITRTQTFTDFLQNVIEVLNTFDDSDLQYFFNVFNDEIKKYNYKDCKFNDIASNDLVKDIINDKLNKFKNLSPINKRKIILSINNIIEERMYYENGKNLIDLINSLYKSGAVTKFQKFIMILKRYGNKVKKHMDLVRIVRNGVRSIIFEYYTNLSDNDRMKLKSYLDENQNDLNKIHDMNKMETIVNDDDKSNESLNKKLQVNNETINSNKSAIIQRNSVKKVVKRFEKKMTTVYVIPPPSNFEIDVSKNAEKIPESLQEDTSETDKITSAETFSKTVEKSTKRRKSPAKDEGYTFRQIYVEKNLDLKYAYDYPHDETKAQQKAHSKVTKTTTKQKRNKTKNKYNSSTTKPSYILMTLYPVTINITEKQRAKEIQQKYKNKIDKTNEIYKITSTTQNHKRRHKNNIVKTEDETSTTSNHKTTKRKKIKTRNHSLEQISHMKSFQKSTINETHEPELPNVRTIQDESKYYGEPSIMMREMLTPRSPLRLLTSHNTTYLFKILKYQDSTGYFRNRNIPLKTPDTIFPKNKFHLRNEEPQFSIMLTTPTNIYNMRKMLGNKTAPMDKHKAKGQKRRTIEFLEVNNFPFYRNRENIIHGKVIIDKRINMNTKTYILTTKNNYKSLNNSMKFIGVTYILEKEFDEKINQTYETSNKVRMKDVTDRITTKINNFITQKDNLNHILLNQNISVFTANNIKEPSVITTRHNDININNNTMNISIKENTTKAVNINNKGINTTSSIARSKIKIIPIVNNPSSNINLSLARVNASKNIINVKNQIVTKSTLTLKSDKTFKLNNTTTSFEDLAMVINRAVQNDSKENIKSFGGDNSKSSTNFYLQF